MSILKKTAAGLSTVALVGAGIVLSAGGAMADPADTLQLDQPSAHDMTATVNCGAGWGGTIVFYLDDSQVGTTEVPSHNGTAQSDTIDLGYIGTGVVSAELYCNVYDANTGEGTRPASPSASAEANQEGVLNITPSNWTSGDTVEITGSGFAPGSEVTFSLYKADADYNRASDEVLHTWTATAGSDGSVTLSVVLPYDESGNFRVEATGVDSHNTNIMASSGYYWNAPESGDNGNGNQDASAEPAQDPTTNQQNKTTQQAARPQALPKTGSELADLTGAGLAGAVFVAGAGAVALRRKH